MKKLTLAVAMVFVASSVVHAMTDLPVDSYESSKSKCINRIEDACNISLVSQVGLEQNVRECKQVTHGLEALLLNSGKISVINTKSCRGSQYRIDSAGIKETKVIDNRLFMLSRDGQVYFMDDDNTLFEILNSRGLSYTTITDIKGVKGGQAVEFIFKNGGKPLVITYHELVQKALRGELRRLYKYDVSGFLGLFW